MKRLLIIVGVGIAMFSMLCIGLALGVVLSPVKANVGRVIDRLFDRDEVRIQIEPRIQSREFVFRQGVRILEVLPDSPAEQAGLEAGQLITAIDGQELDRMNDLASALAEYEPGDRPELTVVLPDGEEQTVIVRLGENPDRPEAAWLGIRFGPPALLDPQDQTPWMPESGEELPALPHRWLDRLPEDVLPFSETMQPGALIREVVEDSPAEAAGLQSGQLIQAVDGQPLDNPRALPDILSSHEPGDSIILTVFDPSPDSEQTSEIEVTLGENPDQPGSAWLGIRFVYLNFKRFTPENLPEG